jgi:hypothetical protein
MMNLKSVISTTALFTLALVITTFSVASASEKILATVSSDSPDRSALTYKLVIDSTDDERTIGTFYKDVYKSGKRQSREALSPSLLIKGGIILEQRDKHIIMRLKSSNFDVQQGGIVTVDTLYNGVKGDRKAYEIQIAQSPNGWALLNKGKVITQIVIQSNRMMVIGEVGIKNLVMK